MIESVLFFSLGFLCAGFLALMIAPAIWRRAVNLTRQRIEASVPLTLNEIQADKDKMRAEFAMSTRRLEMSVKSFQEKAAQQITEIGRNREELRRLATERDEKHASMTALESQAAELRAELRQREDHLQRTATRLEDANKALEERARELERMGGLYEEASLASSGRQIELVSRESEIDRLSGDLARMRNEKRGFDRSLQEINIERKASAEALSAEKKRAAELEAKVERMLATVADREEKLDFREKDLARLRTQLKELSDNGNEASERLNEAVNDKFKLESELAVLSQQMSKLLSGATGGDIEKAIARMNVDRERLEGRLGALVRENKKLRTELTAFEKFKSEDWTEERRASALLREQINDLAAEVVNMTILLDGSDSPIARTIATPTPRAESDVGGQQIVSLADRVRALQQAASSR